MAERLNNKQLTDFASQVSAQNLEILARESQSLTESAAQSASLDRMVLATVEEALVDARILTDAELRVSIQDLQREVEIKKAEYERARGALNAFLVAAGEIKTFDLPSRRRITLKAESTTEEGNKYGTEYENTPTGRKVFETFGAIGTGRIYEGE